MKNTYRPPSLKQAAVACLLSFLFLTFFFAAAASCGASGFCAWLTAEGINNENTLPPSEVTYDSRIFLRPLQHIMQAFLYLIPFFNNGNLAAIFLTLLFTALTTGLFILAVQHAGLPVWVGWCLAALYLLDPVVLASVISASGISILVFFLAFTFAYLITWKDKHFWLALVWIGLGAAMAVLAQFSSLFFLILPVLIALLIAYRAMPHNVYYAENALWIMITPLMYVFLVRFFFGYVLTGDPFAFYQLETGLSQTMAFRGSITLPVLPRLVNDLIETLEYFWYSNPVFVCVSAAALLVSVLKKKGFSAVYIASLWVPLLLLASSRQVGIYASASLIPALLTVSTPLLIINAFRELKKHVWIPVVLSLLLLAAWNGLQWFILL